MIERFGISNIMAIVMALFAGLGWFQAFTKNSSYLESDVVQLKADMVPMRELITDVAVLKMQIRQCGND